MDWITTSSAKVTHYFYLMRILSLLLIVLNISFNCRAQEFNDSLTYELNEVVIEAENQSITNNVSKYIPNSKQKNAAQSGVMLLGLMAIPQLDVDMSSLSVKTMAGRM